MLVETVCEGVKSQVSIDKQVILNTVNDLELIPLPLIETPAPDIKSGTTIKLSNLDQALNFPNEERLRALLLYEYGREAGIKDLCQRTKS